ncbi:MAG: hypothetical protein GF320_22110 [Armatimonadia bacterium]|nr:hypothetical protein [Armatimonadia bacterium]
MLTALLSIAIAAPEPPQRLRTEYLIDPLAIDAAHPRFSWEVTDAAPGAVQSATPGTRRRRKTRRA